MGAGSSGRGGSIPEPVFSSKSLGGKSRVLLVGVDVADGVAISSSPSSSGYFKRAKKKEKGNKTVKLDFKSRSAAVLFSVFAACTDLIGLKRSCQRPQYSSSLAQLVWRRDRRWVLTTSETIFVRLFRSPRSTVTVLIVAKGVELFLGSHAGRGDEAGHVLGAVFVGGVSEDDGGHVAGPAVPAGTSG